VFCVHRHGLYQGPERLTRDLLVLAPPLDPALSWPVRIPAGAKANGSGRNPFVTRYNDAPRESLLAACLRQPPPFASSCSSQLRGFVVNHSFPHRASRYSFRMHRHSCHGGVNPTGAALDVP
jgi:hypothetical protein